MAQTHTTARPDVHPAAHDARPSDGVQGTEGEFDSRYINEDLAPVRLDQRKWRTKDIAALWVAMCACTPTYMLASGLIAEGMSWAQAELTILLGNIIVLLPMILNAHAGTKYGIPFPVYCRSAFGVRGANVPAVLRALVACGWFGIGTWLGGWAIYKIVAVFMPSIEQMPVTSLGINTPQLVCFLLFWGINLWIIHLGIESIRILLNIKAPLLVGLGLLLLLWAYNRAGGFGPMLEKPSAFAVGQPKEGQLWSFFLPALTGMVGFWSTLALNIPDFTRYAHSQRDQALGQAIGLPPTMAFFSFIGVAVTSATVVIYGETLWDPVVLLARFESPIVLIVSLAALSIANLATNIAANVVSPANDFSNLWPSRISFRTGGLITGVIGVLMQPWRLVSDPTGYIFTWLVGYSALLGPVGAILIAEYYVIRRTQLELVQLYRREGPYWYTHGWNPIAIVALVAGILPNLPGFLGTIHVVTVAGAWMEFYHYAWFSGFAISFVVYVALTLMRRPARRAAAS